MIDLGPNLPEKGRYRALYREINRLRDAVRALQPMPSKGTRIRATQVGVAIEPKVSPATPTSRPTGQATWL